MSNTTVTKRLPRTGFTLIEVVTVVTLIGMVSLILLPRLRITPRTHVRNAAELLVRDLEMVRTRALATKSPVRVDFVTGSSTYVAYLDDNQDGVISATAAEIQAVRGFGQRTLASNVVFGMGSAPAIPGDTVATPITFANDRVMFDNRGLPEPFGVRGVIYFTHQDDNTVAGAVSVSGSGSFTSWVYTPAGGWQ
jgi:prepilin-type N-terminal cleavage/methylation domain-containing protein